MERRLRGSTLRPSRDASRYRAPGIACRNPTVGEFPLIAHLPPPARDRERGNRLTVVPRSAFPGKPSRFTAASPSLSRRRKRDART
ncbi:unnamed protein product [Lasius platythorax]|uniref:Uncharacterized protein n=1 Tax=Lasius platythorax TaxID=488582 RepID=A0AAV2P3R5_9HYME